MNRRTKILAGGMVLVGAVMLGDQMGVLDTLQNFGSQHDSALAKLKKQIAVAEDLIMQGALATEQLTALEVRSLPYDRELARSQYQGWLSTLVKQNRLTQSSVDVGLAVPVAIPGGKKEAYTRYPFSINGNGTLEQVTEFLFDFYQGPHLTEVKYRAAQSHGRRFV